MSEWMNGGMNKEINVWMNEWTNKYSSLYHTQVKPYQGVSYCRASFPSLSFSVSVFVFVPTIFICRRCSFASWRNFPRFHRFNRCWSKLPAQRRGWEKVEEGQTEHQQQQQQRLPASPTPPSTQGLKIFVTIIKSCVAFVAVLLPHSFLTSSASSSACLRLCLSLLSSATCGANNN